jgi:HD superfamily phosphodiesterase
MTINQEYPKSDFINDTFNIIKDLSPSERQKVYDYFGFELHKNKNGNSVDNSKYNFSIVGYPVNLNNGKKLAQIDDEQTKQVVEKLRPYVIHFSENNKISCSDENVEASLNEVVKAFPEIRCEIDKLQHSTQDFDVMKHSLKVMQKITQNPEFNKLNESDKKILLLSSLFHDINKSEGARDSAHADESAFDTFYISNKLNLSRDEKVKLYSLCKSHEWLNYVNNDKLTPDEKEKRLQSVAFDLQYDNLFEMAKIFTEGDLKSVKNDNSFFDRYSEDLKINSAKIDNYINELKKSQPLLPVTKLPTASRIEEAITQVNEDGSTNIKGVYKDKSGVVVLKYNEIEDWEKIGFPSGSSSKGINATAIKGTGKHTKEKEIETGNIKFFAHGLDFENQLSKFDAFALPDSDALLSVSYAERPESKYRFFRTQGVLLDVDTKYIFGGGNTDKGSGCKKDVKNFKDNYIFGGKREEDRLYISNLIKENLNLSDEEYVKFVNENKNKSLTEIEPEEIRTKLIQAFATINSNVRKGEREYNEMYVTNPRVMGVFAYSPENKIGDINNFMNNQEDFLKQYAKDNNLPFVIFGD